MNSLSLEQTKCKMLNSSKATLYDRPAEPPQLNKAILLLKCHNTAKPLAIADKAVNTTVE